MEFGSNSDKELQEKYKFIPIYNLPSNEKSTKQDPFILIPNAYILGNPTKTCNVNRIFLVVYCLIAWHQTYFGESFISIRQVFESCHYSCSHKKPKLFYEIIKSLYFFQAGNCIALIDFDPENLSYDTIISMHINPDVFNPQKRFTLLREKDYSAIMQPESKQSKENLLHSFLYICAHMCRKTEPKIEKPNESLPYYMRRKTSVEEMLEQDRAFISDQSPPEAYWGSEEKACSDLSMSKQTFSDCLAYLCSLDHPLLIKRSLGYITRNGQPTKKRYPSIYVLNQPGYNAELNKAERLIKQYEEENGNAEKES